MIIRRVATLLYGTVLLIVGIDPGAAAFEVGPPDTAATARSAYEILPLMFEARGDEKGAPVALVSHGHAQRIAVTRDAVHVALPEDRGRNDVDTRAIDDHLAQIEAKVVTLRFAGANADAHLRGLDAQPGRIHYLRTGSTPGNRVDIPMFARAAIEALYPRIDATVYGTRRAFEYDLVVAPGGDPDAIRMRIEGASKTALDDSGNAVITTSGGNLLLRRPIAWQGDAGERRTVDAAFVLHSSMELAFAVGDYDHTRPLLIDPVIAYATYVGGSYPDGATAIAVDANGSAYVAGYTTSANFPLKNPFDASFNKKGDMEAFVAKLAPDGKSLVYATYLGGPTGRDLATGIAVDAAGNAYVTGTTSAGDFPVTKGAYRSGDASGGSFVAKLNPAGNALVYSTYVVGATTHALAIDAAGSAYVTGKAKSAFITTSGAFQRTSPIPSGEAGFVLKLDPTGSTANYATFFGASESGYANSIAVDTQGRAYVGGQATGSLPLVLPLQPAAGGGIDGFVSVLDASGSHLVSSTWIGGSRDDMVNALALGADGAVYVAGETYSANFPSVNGFQRVKSGHLLVNSTVGNAFIAKLDLQARRIVWSSFLGGEICSPGCRTLFDDLQYPGDAAYGLAVDAGGHAYVTGIARSLTFPLVDSASRHGTSNEASGFAAKVSAAGSTLLYSTFLRTGFSTTGSIGRFPEGAASAVAVDGAGAAYVTSTSGSAGDFSASAGAFQSVDPGIPTPIVVKFSPPSRHLTMTSSNLDADVAAPLTMTATLDGAITTGYVHFVSGTRALGSVALDANRASLTMGLPAGIHTLSAWTSTPDGWVDTPPLLQVVDQPLVCTP